MELTANDWQDYELLDSGKGRKLERFGPVTLIRPEPRAVWQPAAPASDWERAGAEFTAAEKGGGGKWKLRNIEENRWSIAYKGLRMWVEIEQSKQVGVFPENAVQWDWIEAQVARAKKPVRVLNLFGYTGLASLAAAAAGAEVTHIDSSRRAIRLGQENQVLSGLGDRPIRWIVEDALKFVEREARRGNKYEGIVMDPPKYGLGPKKERWEFFEGFGEICRRARELLSERPRFVVVTAYALESPPSVLEASFGALAAGLGGTPSYGELVTVEKSAERRINYSIYGRWAAEGVV